MMSVTSIVLLQKKKHKKLFPFINVCSGNCLKYSLTMLHNKISQRVMFEKKCLIDGVRYELYKSNIVNLIFTVDNCSCVHFILSYYYCGRERPTIIVV